MTTLINLAQAFWQHDIATLSNPFFISFIYLLIFATVLLENGVLPLAVLPGDSLLLLVGVLAAKGVLSYLTVVITLTIAAALGSWLGYYQGRWLIKSKWVSRWYARVPTKYQQRTQMLFMKHGLLALFIGRFLAFIRTLLPMLAGITQLSNKQFSYFNILSAFLWIFTLTSLGLILGNTTLYDRYEVYIFRLLTLIPLGLLAFSLLGSLIITLFTRAKKRSSLIS